MSTETILFLLPEMILVAVATLIYLDGAFCPGRPARTWLAVGGIVIAGLALSSQYHQHYWSEGAKTPSLVIDAASSAPLPLALDLFNQYFRWLTLGMGLLFVLLASRAAGPSATHPGAAAEYLGTLLMAIAGVMLVASARDLVMLFVSLELLSIPTYVLLYLGKRDGASQESTVKYFFLSVLSSAFLLYGFSFLYGVTGSTDLGRIREVLAAGGDFRLLARVALVLILAGLGFRITAVPFHFYAPDVYQGTTQGNAGLLAVLPKIAGFVVLLRVLLFAMPGLEEIGWRVTLVLSVITMTMGNVLALWQNNVRRLLAYSSIAHAGYMLIGLAVAFAVLGQNVVIHEVDGRTGVLFYLAVYAVATTGVFAALTYLGSHVRQIDDVDELAGLSRSQPGVALVIALFMFSLAGIPPLAGFWGKFSLFWSALEVQRTAAEGAELRTWFIGLAIVGGLNAAIAAAYYLRIVGTMYFRAANEVPPAAEGGRGAWLSMVACAVLVVLIGIRPGPLMTGATKASESAELLRGAAFPPPMAQSAQQKNPTAQPKNPSAPSEKQASLSDTVQPTVAVVPSLPRSGETTKP